jgi:hypothetical protein
MHYFAAPVAIRVHDFYVPDVTALFFPDFLALDVQQVDTAAAIETYHHFRDAIAIHVAGCRVIDTRESAIGPEAATALIEQEYIAGPTVIPIQETKTTFTTKPNQVNGAVHSLRQLDRVNSVLGGVEEHSPFIADHCEHAPAAIGRPPDQNLRNVSCLWHPAENLLAIDFLPRQDFGLGKIDWHFQALVRVEQPVTPVAKEGEKDKQAS